MTITKEEGQEIGAGLQRGEKRMEDLYKIADKITSEYVLEYVGTNHIILHDKGTGERFDLRGKLTILKWCVCYLADTTKEDNIPLSTLYYLPIVLIRKASDKAMVREFEANGREVDKKAISDIVDCERFGITAKCTLTKSFRADGKLVYFDAYELALADRLDEYLADIANKHLLGEISDDKFERLIGDYDMNQLLFERDSGHGE